MLLHFVLYLISVCSMVLSWPSNLLFRLSQKIKRLNSSFTQQFLPPLTLKIPACYHDSGRTEFSTAYSQCDGRLSECRFQSLILQHPSVVPNAWHRRSWTFSSVGIFTLLPSLKTTSSGDPEGMYSTPSTKQQLPSWIVTVLANKHFITAVISPSRNLQWLFPYPNTIQRILSRQCRRIPFTPAAW